MKEEFTELDDQQIRAALHDVELPNGLGERLRSRLRSVAQSPSMPPAVAAGVEPAVPPSTTTHATTTPAGDPPVAVGSGRRSLLVLALAAGISGLLFGLYHFSRPLTPERLTAHCLAQLQRLQSGPPAWHAADTQDADELEILKDQLNLNIRLLGFQDQAGAPFAERCRVWGLFSVTTQKPFYVFDFRDPVAVQGLARHLQATHQTSGGWTLYAMRDGDRLLVVAFEGSWHHYLRRMQSA